MQALLSEYGIQFSILLRSTRIERHIACQARHFEGIYLIHAAWPLFRVRYSEYMKELTLAGTRMKTAHNHPRNRIFSKASENQGTLVCCNT